MAEFVVCMARTRSENYDEIQLGILRKAAVLFATQGYERTSITDLADACGLSRGALYHYFGSKDALLFAMLDTLTRGLLAKLRATVEPGDPPRDVLSRMIEAFVEHNAGSPNEQIILLRDLESLSEGERAQIRSVEHDIVDLVADHLARVDTRGRMRGEGSKVYTMLLFGMINYTFTWYDPQGPVKPTQFAGVATDVFLNGFLSAIPALDGSGQRTRRKRVTSASQLPPASLPSRHRRS